MGVGNKTIGRGPVVMGPKGKLEVIGVSKPLETPVVSFVEMVCIVGSSGLSAVEVRNEHPSFSLALSPA